YTFFLVFCLITRRSQTQIGVLLVFCLIPRRSQTQIGVLLVFCLIYTRNRTQIGPSLVFCLIYRRNRTQIRLLLVKSIFMCTFIFSLCVFKPHLVSILILFTGEWYHSPVNKIFVNNV